MTGIAMPWWPLPVLLFAAWCAGTWAVVARYAVEDARNGVPKGKRRGVSCMPGIPCGPLVLWGVALLIDLVAEPWGTAAVGLLHAAWLVVAVGSAASDTWRLRRIEKGE